MLRSFLLSTLLLSFGFLSLRAENYGTGANLLSGDFENGFTSYNPWAGVDDLGNLHVIAGNQWAISDSGARTLLPFSPSVSVADLNGDGLPDLVVADARGFFWYYPNSGKPDAPAFTHGEVMPIWIGGGGFEGDAVPRIQVVDFTGDGKLSVVAGNYFGGLYYIRNSGSTSTPSFRMPQKREDVQVATRKKDVLWCNYLAPFLYDWGGVGHLDLLLGDGSYSANSIYYLTNRGNNDHPTFNEDFTQKIIPGMGREHLTPQVVDWNNDGKPDIITGERVGDINVYLNQAADKNSPPVFDKDAPQLVTFGGVAQTGAFTTVGVGDLNKDKLFDLVVSSTDGTIKYALNTGTPGSPQFGALQPFKGVNQYPKIMKPKTWAPDRYRPDGPPYELAEVVTAETEKGFVPPPAPEFKGKGALKFSIVKPQNVYFPDFFESEDLTRTLRYSANIHVEMETRYILSCWVRTEGDVSDLTWHTEGYQSVGVDTIWTQYTGNTLGGGSTWSHVTTDLRFPNALRDNPTGGKETGNFVFWLYWKGKGNLYLDDIELKKGG